MTHTFDFTHDWISGYWPLWEKHLPATASRVLEIGCFEGRSTVWFAQRYPGASITCIDTFSGGLDHQQLGLDFSDTKRRWLHNTQPWSACMSLLETTSRNGLLILQDRAKFDIALIDGSHVAADVLTDLVLAWPLVATGGILIADDYGWGQDRPPHETPGPAIDAFLACHAGQYELLDQGYQVLVRKV